MVKSQFWVDYDFEPGRVALVKNTALDTDLDKKSNPQSLIASLHCRLLDHRKVIELDVRWCDS